MKVSRDQAADIWFRLEKARRHAETSRKHNALRRLIRLTLASTRAEALYCRLTAIERAASPNTN